MSQRTRMRWFALCLALAVALALPLARPAAADEPKSGSKKGESAHAKKDAEAEEEGEGEEEAEEEDWSPTHRGVFLVAHATYAFPAEPSAIEYDAQHEAGLGALHLNSHVEDAWGFGVRLGYRVIDRLALEGQFEFLNDMTIEQHAQGNGGSDNHTIARVLTATGNAKAYLLTGRLQPYALAGIGYGNVDLDPQGGIGGNDDRSSGFVARFGLGTDFYLSESLGVMVEASYMLPTGPISNYDYVGINGGLLLHF